MPILVKILDFLDFWVFANEIGKLWGFHLQKPHNLNFGIMGLLQMKSKIMGFLRKNPRFSEILQMKSENYGVLPEIMGFFANEIGLWGFFGIFANEKPKNRHNSPYN